MPRRRVKERVLTGDKALDRRLKSLERKAANRAARAGLWKGARLAARLIKKEVPAKQKSVRRSIGSSVKKDRSKVTKAKAGAAVGRARKTSIAKAKSRDASRSGVGISAQNIHWFIMGTDNRTQNTTGRSTGSMPPHPMVKNAMQGGGSRAVVAAIKEGTENKLIKEAQKIART